MVVEVSFQETGFVEKIDEPVHDGYPFSKPVVSASDKWVDYWTSAANA
jgi:hypothetical protein